MPWGFLVIFSTWFSFLCAQVSSGIEILRFLPGINNNQSKTCKSSPLKRQPRLKSCFKFGTSIADNVTKVETLCPQRHLSGFDGTIHGFRKKFLKKLFPASLEMLFCWLFKPTVLKQKTQHRSILFFKVCSVWPRWLNNFVTNCL